VTGPHLQRSASCRMPLHRRTSCSRAAASVMRSPRGASARNGRQVHSSAARLRPSRCCSTVAWRSSAFSCRSGERWPSSCFIVCWDLPLGGEDASPLPFHTLVPHCIVDHCNAHKESARQRVMIPLSLLCHIVALASHNAAAHTSVLTGRSAVCSRTNRRCWYCSRRTDETVDQSTCGSRYAAARGLLIMKICERVQVDRCHAL